MMVKPSGQILMVILDIDSKIKEEVSLNLSFH